MANKLTVRTTRSLQSAILGLALASAAGGCSSNNTSVSALPADVKAIMFLQRVPSNGAGNVFDYAHFVPGTPATPGA